MRVALNHEQWPSEQRHTSDSKSGVQGWQTDEHSQSLQGSSNRICLRL